MSILSSPVFDWFPLLALLAQGIAWVSAFLIEKTHDRVVLQRLRNVGFLATAVMVLTLARVYALGGWTLDIGWAFYLPLTFYFDTLGALMLVLVNWIGAICLTFSVSYLEGDGRQFDFLARMQLTITAATVVLMSGSLLTLWLAWVALGMALHSLLLFRRDRPRARTAVLKRIMVARVGDLTLAAGFALLLIAGGTSNIADLAAMAKTGVFADNLFVQIAMVLVVVTAMIQSAQLPSHSWLIEVMEAPTPVSALLHAGIVNAGGYLVLRFADILITAPGAMTVLAAIGAVTACVATMVMLFQSSIKISLAWSTVAQMGFMMLQCGLGAFSAAVLHILAHSCYKAHAFLSSGSVIDTARVMTLAGPAPKLSPTFRALVLGTVASLYTVLAAGPLSIATAAEGLFGLVLVIGVTQLVIDEMGGGISALLTSWLFGIAAISLVIFVVAHAGAGYLVLPAFPGVPDILPLTVIAYGFGAGVIGIALMRGWLIHPDNAGRFAALRIHLANGLYMGHLSDLWVGHYMSKKGA